MELPLMPVAGEERSQNPIPRRLTAMERGFLRYQARNPSASMLIGGMAMVSGEVPSIQEFRLLVRQIVTQRFPELACRLSDGPLRRAEWVSDSHLDMTSLVHERKLPDQSGEAALQAAVNEMISTSLPPERPLWRVWLVHGHASQEFALVYMGHHALHDGVAVANAVLSALAGPGKAISGAPARRLPGNRQTPLRTALGISKFAREFLPLARPGGSSGLSGKVEVVWSSTSLDRIRSIARVHDTTINAVYLAALTAVLRDWPESPWHDLAPDGNGAPLWAIIPFSTRTAAEQGKLGQRALGFRMPLPCEQSDPREQVRIITERIHRLMTKGRLDIAHSMSSSMPNWMGQLFFDLQFSTRHAHLIATNVPGPKTAIECLGRTVTGVVPITFLPNGHRLGAAFLTYGGQACISFAVDARSSDKSGLVQLWSKALDDLSV
ncbi:wax ester/triacylglycerol synthase domain-containing protein [Actinomadura rudentiformis]|uniref:diacylglycerol O-acyltransferase n=1 Tax=Actinomadura rudentiformis TaxID=359158 RepID=A0A6H9Y8K0_9ACTN|nr:wax ester/triacylglycerol synthase domain-containing protein [Actinomadura rudentiformis]KAB2340428.1 DUF1298 domain-containing protein [Actinomadura rudentiformis]